MGVKGLWRIIQEDYGKSPCDFQEVIARGSTLLVDGWAFLFHLLDNQINSLYPDVIYRRELGGSYEILRKLIRAEITRLRQYFGFHLIVYFDGPISYFKGHTSAKRRKQQEEKWNHLYEATLGDTKIQQARLPLPPLAKEQFLLELAAMKVETKMCPFEADQELAKDCNFHNQRSSNSYYCYSKDSDFLLMKDCPLIEIGSLDQYGSKGDQIREVSVDVWTRDKLARLYGISEDILVIWGIVHGNDFTEPFSGLLTNDVEFLGLPLAEFREALSAETCQLPLGNPEIRFSWITEEEWKVPCEYSWSFYELEDLTPFYLPQYLTQVQSKASVSDQDDLAVVQLKGAQRKMITTWVEEHAVVNAMETADPIYLNKLVIECLQDMQQFHSLATELHSLTIEEENNHTAEGVVALPFLQDTDMFTVFQGKHFTGLQEMTSLLRSQSMNNSNCETKNTKKALRLQWDNVCVATIYQLVGKEIQKQLDLMHNKSNNANANVKEMVSLQPKLLYDGWLFHSTMDRQSKQVISTTPVKGIEEHMTNHTSDALDALITPVKSTITATPPNTNSTIKATPSSNKIKITAIPSNLTPTQALMKSKTGPKSSTKITPTPTKTQPVSFTQQVVLPVDSYKDMILQRMQQDRVTIIHGETGCGKSSRIPLFILESHESRKQYVKIMICQPRRIAVVNLRNRLRDQIGDKVGMRMGHGVKEDSPNTKVFFVTTGYLLRLIAYHPQAMASITHLIIDEVHERSVEGDILTWLAKKNLTLHPQLRVVLMSATLHIALYKNYFNDFLTPRTDNDYCLSVGQKRFPVEIFFVEQLLTHSTQANQRKLPSLLQKKIQEQGQLIVKQCAQIKSFGAYGLSSPSATMIKAQYELTVNLIRTMCEEGSSVIVFVSGLHDIIELQSRFDQLNTSKYTIVSIHSEIPFEEQEAAFIPPTENEVKVILATNAAESSVTLPNVNTVICLGTHKAVDFKPGEYLRSTLTNTWISKSSATQRAGRTGRLAPGKVFRLYTEDLFNQWQHHESAEIHRKPLHENILSLKAIFQKSGDYHGVLPILEELLETPDLSTIEDSFRFLFDEGMITSPNDTSYLTSLGSFAGALPVDLISSKILIHGIALGIGIEAILLVAALLQPKTIFRIAHPLVHANPQEYCQILSQTFFGAVHYDEGNYSDPLLMIRLFLDWHGASESHRHHIQSQYGVVKARMTHFISTAKHIQQKISELQDLVPSHLSFDQIPSNKTLSLPTIQKLRLILLWNLHFNLMHARIDKESGNKNDQYAIDLKSATIQENKYLSEELFNFYLPTKYLSYKIESLGKLVYKIPTLKGMDLGYIQEIGPQFFLLVAKYFYDQQISQQPPSEQKEQEEGNKAGKNAAQLRLLDYLLVTVRDEVLNATAQAQAQAHQQQQENNNGRGSQNNNNKAQKNNKKTRVASTLTSLRTNGVFVLPNHYDINFAQYANQNELLLHMITNMLGLEYPLQSTVMTNYGVVIFSFIQVPDSIIEAIHNTLLSAIQYSGVLLPIMNDSNSQTNKLFVNNFYPFPRDLFHQLYANLLYPKPLSRQEVENIVDSLKSSDSLRVLQFTPKAGYEVTPSGSNNSTEPQQSEFVDVCLGRRLFNLISVGYRDKKFRVLESDFKAAVSKTASPFFQPVVGSAAWIQEKERNRATVEEDVGHEDLTVKVLNIAAAVNSWKIVHVSTATEETNGHGEGEEEAFSKVNVLQDYEEHDALPLVPITTAAVHLEEEELLAPVNFDEHAWLTAVVSQRSVLSGSRFLPSPQHPTKRIYGVAYSAMAAGSRGQQIVICETLSLFPSELWVTKGLFCINKWLHKESPKVLERLPAIQSASSDSTTTVVSLCESILEHLKGLKNHSISSNDAFIAQVELLFQE